MLRLLQQVLNWHCLILLLLPFNRVGITQRLSQLAWLCHLLLLFLNTTHLVLLYILPKIPTVANNLLLLHLDILFLIRDLLELLQHLLLLLDDLLLLVLLLLQLLQQLVRLLLTFLQRVLPLLQLLLGLIRLSLDFRLFRRDFFHRLFGLLLYLGLFDLLLILALSIRVFLRRLRLHWLLALFLNSILSNSRIVSWKNRFNLKNNIFYFLQKSLSFTNGILELAGVGNNRRQRGEMRDGRVPEPVLRPELLRRVKVLPVRPAVGLVQVDIGAQHHD